MEITKKDGDKFVKLIEELKNISKQLDLPLGEPKKESFNGRRG